MIPALVAEFVKIIEIVEVDLIGHTLPEDMGGVRVFHRHAIGSCKDIARVNEILHKGKADLIEAPIEPILVDVACD